MPTQTKRKPTPNLSRYASIPTTAPPTSSLISDHDVAQAVINAGFSADGRLFNLKDPAAVLAVAVVLAEHRGNPTLRAINVNTDGSIDRGPWQFNSKWHPEVSAKCAFDLDCSTKQAFRVSLAGTTFSQWAVTKGDNPVILAYMERAARAVAALVVTDEELGGKSGWITDIMAKAIDVLKGPAGILKGPVEAVANAIGGIDSVVDFLRKLADVNTWIRIAAVVGGAILLFFGLRIFMADIAAPAVRAVTG